MEYSFRDRKGLYAFTMMLVLFGLMLVSLYLSLALVKQTLPALFGITNADSFISSPDEQIKNPLALLYLQAMTSSIGFFLVPVILYHMIFRYDIVREMGMKNVLPAKYWLMTIGIMFMAGIFIQWLVQVNTAISLPVKWQWLRAPQVEIDRMMDALFSERGRTRFLMLTLVMALLPAIAEELCFRGTIQNTLSQTDLGSHGAILFTGLSFALVHFEFDNFLGIWCMGLVLGYLYYYSGSIWISVVAHFFNNFLMIAGKYAYITGTIHTDVAKNDILPLYLTLPAGVVMIYGLSLMRKWQITSTPPEEA